MICRYMRMDASIILDEIDLEGKKKCNREALNTRETVRQSLRIQKQQNLTIKNSRILGFLRVQVQLTIRIVEQQPRVRRLVRCVVASRSLLFGFQILGYMVTCHGLQCVCLPLTILLLVAKPCRTLLPNQKEI